MRILVALMGAFLSFGVAAQALKYTEGKEYQLITPAVATADSSKIEVTEVFAYSCPHCFHFEPMVSAWAKKQAADVQFIQTHAMWSPQMEPHLRGFYTAVTLKIKDKTHLAAFNAIHLEHKNLDNAEQWADFFSLYGVPKEKAIKTYNSFGVSSQIKQAEARQRGYKVTGTPEMVVEGKYRISSRETGGQKEMLEVVDFLVEKVRRERKQQRLAP
jgi:protein dithiol oxidoreductase (disulfide-forming)